MNILFIIGSFSLQNFSISGLPDNTYYLYISSDSLVFPAEGGLLPNERLSDNDKYSFFLPIKLSSCPIGGILEKKNAGFKK